MATGFEPKLSILPEQQRRLWPELRAVPQSFVLFGGTAIALQLGHRASLDFDFLTEQIFDPDKLYSDVSFLHGSTPIQKATNTLTCTVDRGGPVQVSFFATPALKLIEPPLVANDIGLKIASLLDLAGMKAAVVQKRPEARDYLDLDAIIQQSSINLSTALAAARLLYGQSLNPELTLKSLSFFGDGNLGTLTRPVRERLVAAVRSVDLDRLPTLERRPKES
jgi:hypothetical protein